jgi:hypothetical protein
MGFERGVERYYRLGQRHADLARRSRESQATRVPLIFVPSCFGVRLRDDHDRLIWGSTFRLFCGTSFSQLGSLRADGVIDSFPVLPGSLRYDINGGLLRYLVAVGGYTLDEDLFVLSYDWRQNLTAAATDLARLVRRIRGASSTKVDILTVSTGGMVVRHFLASAGQNLEDAEAEPGLGNLLVRRVVYVGAAQRGIFSSFAHSQRGLSFFTGGRHWSWDEVQRLPITFDLLPHPDESIFVDPQGVSLPYSHFDPEIWHQLGLRGRPRADLPEILAAAARRHRLLDRVSSHPSAVVIGARNKPTPSRAIVSNSKVLSAGDTHLGLACATEPGDGFVPARSMAQVGGLD